MVISVTKLMLGTKKFNYDSLLCGVAVIALTACVTVPQEGTTQQGKPAPIEELVKLPLTATAVSNVNVRSGPGTDNGVVYTLAQNQQVEILGEENNWYQIRNQSDSSKSTGWVRYDLLVLESIDTHKLKGHTTTRVKMRSGPGTSHSVVTIADAGESLNLKGGDANWYNIRSGDFEGWIRNDFVVLNMTDLSVGQAVMPTKTAMDSGAEIDGEQVAGLVTTAMVGSILPFERRVEYAGYSKDFQPIKLVMQNGNLGKTYSLLEARDKNVFEGAEDFTDNEALLPLMEHASLLVDSGDTGMAKKYFSYAEDILRLRDNRSMASSAIQSTLSSVSSFAGAGELGEYTPEGYERVLLLNYKTIAYLLEGKREAYNVTLRAIHLQNEERANFQKILDEAIKEIKEEKNKDSQDDFFGKNIDKIYEGYNDDAMRKAKTVDDAYVNPFGDYMAGLVLEIDGYRDQDMLNNAAISYNKASALNPKIKFLREAISDTKSRKIYNDKSKIVHVIIADGLAPERKTMIFGLPFIQGTIPIKVPVYESEENQIGNIDVTVKGQAGKISLEKLADVEAIALRHDIDSRPIQMASVFVNVLRSYIEKKALSKFEFLGEVISNVRESMSNPDMRSWMTLPSSYQVNRLVVPVHSTELTVSTYDTDGKKVIEKAISLAEEGPTIIYGRSINRTLSLQSSTNTWVAN